MSDSSPLPSTRVAQMMQSRPSRPALLQSLTVLLVLVATVYTVIWSCVVGSAFAGWVLACTAALGPTVPWIHRRTGSFSSATHVFTFLIFAPVMILVACTGGFKSPVLMWLIVVPLAAMTLNGPRAGACWLAVVVIETALVGMADPHQFIHWIPLTSSSVQILSTSSVISLAASIYLCLFADFVSLSHAHRQLHYQAHHDNLTGLLNRHALLALLSETLSSSPPGAGTALVMVDIDLFKRINDLYGHTAGDVAIQEVSRRIRTHVRPSDYVGRYGGEEFLCVLPECSQTNAMLIAESIREAVERHPIDVGGDQASLTVSIGVSMCPGPAECDELRFIQRVDQALYEAKNNGRNQIRVAGRRTSSLAAV